MLILAEKGIRGRICHAIHGISKANSKYMKDYDKQKQSSYRTYWDVNNLYGWARSQKLPVGGFRLVENTSQFNKDFMKNYSEDDDGYFLEVDVQYPKKLHEFHDNLPLLHENYKSWKTCTIKK